jgi:hypothetical protein
LPGEDPVTQRVELLLVALLPAAAAAMARMARPMEPPAFVRAAPRIRAEVLLLCGS